MLFRKKDNKMGIKKFSAQIKSLFQSAGLHQAGKKESIQRFLAKLKTKKETFDTISKETSGKKDLADLKEDLAIITLQIKKGEHLLEKLST